jgi:hypothetical protein
VNFPKSLLAKNFIDRNDMGKTKSSDFGDKIDAAIDDLFKPQRTVEIDPLTSEVKVPVEVKAPVDAEKKAAPATSTADDNSQSAPLSLLLEKLDQSFLTLDWEITPKGVTDFQDLLADIKQIIKPEVADLHSLISAMNEILDKISTAPEQVPPSASKTLQTGIGLLKEFSADNQLDPQKLKTDAAAIIKGLQKITPDISKPDSPEPAEAQGAEFGEDLMRADLPEVKVPLELTNLINLHLTILAQCINRILPLEKLFGQNNLYDKYLSAHQFVRQSLEEEKDRLSTALNASYNVPPTDPAGHLPAGLATALESHISVLRECQETIRPIEILARKKGAKKLYKVEKEIRQQLEHQIFPLNKALSGEYLAVCTSTSPDFSELLAKLADHIDDLGKCIKQVIPLENLFGKTKGYEKLHAAQKRIRVQLEIQKKNLSTAKERFDSAQRPLDSAQPTTHNNTSISPAAENIFTKAQACPWSNLRAATWNGQMVALLPEELAFEDRDGKAAKKLRPRQEITIKIKKLKAWPWTKLAPTFSGDLASLPESKICALELNELMPLMPLTDANAAAPRNERMIFLYKDARGGFAILDGPTKEMAIDKSWQWQPLDGAQGFMLKGFIVKGNERLPVLSVAYGREG